MIKETQDYTCRCSTQDFVFYCLLINSLADHDVGIMVREAAEVLQVKSGFLFFSSLVKIKLYLNKIAGKGFDMY
jgi:hypothetical protein